MLGGFERRRRLVIFCGALAGFGIGLALPVAMVEAGALAVLSALLIYRHRRRIC